jgi:hypothetical protein
MAKNIKNIKSIKKGFTSFTSFQLKIIALVIMTVDHFGAYKLFTQSAGINAYMRIIGRISAPLFLFLLVEGLRHTRNKKKYIVRLYTAAVFTQIIKHILIEQFTGFFMGNIFQTFFYAALYITCFETIVKAESGKPMLTAAGLMILPVLFILLPDYAAVRIFFPSLLTIEYTFLFVILAVVWYFINNKYINCLIFVVLAMFLRMYNHILGSLQWLMVLAIPFIFLYNGEKGQSGLKYLFYIYYPAHQILFFFLSAYLSG